jgi:hypothetical protein
MTTDIHAATFSIDACEEAFVRDFCPYKGNPDPLTVWRAAWQARDAEIAALRERLVWREETQDVLVKALQTFITAAAGNDALAMVLDDALGQNEELMDSIRNSASEGQRIARQIRGDGGKERKG